MLASLATATAGDKPKIGDILIFAGDYAPEGWAFCDGQQLDVSGNQTLFDQLGVKYGGDGRASFSLPNLKNQEADLNGVRFLISLKEASSRAETGEESPLVGEISFYAGETAPEGWAFCDGSELSVSGNSELATVLGSRYGGDGVSTVGLPNLEEAEKTLGGMRYIIALDGVLAEQN